ncbi:RDD family protein [Actinoplanes teichomyceticus]|uniref:RDD family protein n=1 Tax=Actinoplanes teichomyceticus TaxID=1867 RepID=A0A561VJ63_ACTTI|nr:RDD family protein [Actinoplanes teichomyceticus]TWG11652.1 RDD family protein [Actinoplanes teichomyceticus]GIF15491.1 hypothetical protein Ate01nite_55230 [Actinoplanes teichomyceticus]
MTYPYPDGTPSSEPPTQVPTTPPPHTGVAPDLGVPVVGSLHAAAADLHESVAKQVGAPPPYPVTPPYAGYQTPPYGGYPPPAYPAPNLVTPGGRLGAQLLEAVLITFTGGIGWLVWALLIFGRGQTPARQLLGHVVVDGLTGQPFTWGRMAARELLIKGLLGYFAGVLTIGVYSLIDALMVFGERARTLHDKMAGSVVVYK